MLSSTRENDIAAAATILREADFILVAAGAGREALALLVLLITSSIGYMKV